MSLITCASCTRHVRSTETGCPFCGAPREPSEGPEPAVSRAPTRAGVMLGVVIGAVAITGAALTSGCVLAYGGPSTLPDGGTDGGTDANH
jgi:hypothetical protein